MASIARVATVAGVATLAGVAMVAGEADERQRLYLVPRSTAPITIRSFRWSACTVVFRAFLGCLNTNFLQFKN